MDAVLNSLSAGLVIPILISGYLISSFFKILLMPFNFRSTIVPSSSTAVEETKSDSLLDAIEVINRTNNLACPICYNPLSTKPDPATSVEEERQSSLNCVICKKSYFGNATHIDLTVVGGAKEYVEAMPAFTELFRRPLVSFLYERGWRQSFKIWGGFPGPEQEFEMAKEYLEPVLGGNIIDASCGSGMFSRLFAKSGLFSLVVALDFSENMLRQCYQFIEKDDNFPKENLILVRADISRLPFTSGSVDAVNAGAALHCWSSPSTAVAEISRVLRPGGVFVATTFILDGPFTAFPLLKHLRQNIGKFSGSHVFIAERELEELCNSCGLEGFTCTRNRRFVMLSARKPN